VFIVRSKLNPRLVLCTNRDWLPDTELGPGKDYSAKIYKTRVRAEKVRDGRVLVEEYNP